MTGAGDYFRVIPTSPWTASYVKTSKAALVSIPREVDYGYQQYMCLAYCMTDAIKTTIWNVDYRTNYRRFIAYGNSASGYKEISQKTANYMTLAPIFKSGTSNYTEGVYEVLYGDPQICGFYEVGGQLFYICAGLAIKDE